MTGDAEPTAAFNRLVARFHLDGIDQSTAKDLALLFYCCVFDPDGRNHMSNWLQLRLRVEEYAYGKFDEGLAEHLLSAWWRQFTQTKKHSDVEITSRPISGGFQVELPVFRVLPKREVALLKSTVSVSAHGNCRLEPDAIVFQHPMRDPHDKADF